ncbi:MAG TPA: serine hydrolase domain-containing protein, partial [Gemmatimonadaceae bacterium]|nr:serine hydrolase domain-containing protein [Gemmatimonadaceae bacterium]
RRGEIAYLKTYGYRDVGHNLPLTANSVMSAASLTKAAFATVVMELVQRGTLDLDKPIAQYLPKPLPEYAKYSDLRGDGRYKTITLRMLLDHTSGFANWRWFEKDRHLAIHFQPGSRYAYSGEGMDLAQMVVETVTGKTVAVLMRELLFQPLGMTRTSIIWEPKFEDDVANGYDEKESLLERSKPTQANVAGSMQTTIHDYAIFLSGFLRHRLLDARTTSEMLRRQITINSAHQFPTLAPETTTENAAIGLGYGLGWGLYKSPAGPAFFKEGHDDGWRHLALLFENGDGILIMTNSSNGEAIFKPLIDSLLGPTAFPFQWEGYTP